MATIGETLKRLATTFTAKDIMVPEEKLICGNGTRSAAILSRENPDFSLIPIRNRSGLTGFFERDSGKGKLIALRDVISDGTNLVDLVEILAVRQFCFVLSHSRLAGYIHYSDLNHQLVKLTFYALIAALERSALQSIQLQLSEPNFLRTNLSPSRFEQVNKAYKRAGDAGRNLANYLNIADILRLAKNEGTMGLEDTDIQVIKTIRNRASHAGEDLVSEVRDLEMLIRVKRESLRLLST